uniref:Tubulin-specific chaperone C-like n=1 Tax=Phallusia mammillata TaxID=59560 RepID=A0A6F9DTS0_9ASCI|nr:tubulin-specific chaperone C-like [Phallusia mammillata]
MAVQKAEAFTISETENVLTDKKDFIANKLSERKQARTSKWTQQHEESEGKKVTEEKSSFFQKYFNDEISTITNLLQCTGIAPTDRLALTEHFDSIVMSHQRLQKFFNDSVMFLPAFKARVAQEQLNLLMEEINEKKNNMIPKKKFTFKSKVKKSENKENSHEAPVVNKGSGLQKYAQKLNQGCEISGKTDETITLNSNVVNHKDLTLSKLVGCKVYLLGAPSTVHINNVEKCTIVIGPVSGSVFVDWCTDCEIATGCQQLRVHHTSDTNFYLNVSSRAIIEDTTKVGFAPYNFDYPELENHLKLAGLNGCKNNWNKVDDFNWLAMDSVSPNWQIINAENRRNLW